jgi:hypothetical protein
MANQVMEWSLPVSSHLGSDCILSHNGSGSKVLARDSSPDESGDFSRKKVKLIKVPQYFRANPT